MYSRKMEEDGWKTSLGAQQQFTELEKQKKPLKNDFDEEIMSHNMIQQTLETEKEPGDEEKSTLQQELQTLLLQKMNDKLQYNLSANETRNISLTLEARAHKLEDNSSHLKELENSLEDLDFQQDSIDDVSTSNNKNNGTTATNMANSALHEKEIALDKANYVISDLKMKLADLQQGKANKEKEFQNMKDSFSSSKLEVLEEVKKLLIVSHGENTKQASELTRLNNELEIAIKNQERLQVVQRDTECQKNNAEAAKLALEKKFIDQEKKLLQENNAATRETQRIEETMTKEQEALQMQLNGAESEVEKLKQETEALKDTLLKEKDSFSSSKLEVLEEVKKLLIVSHAENTNQATELTRLNNELEIAIKNQERLQVFQRNTECQKNNAEAAKLDLEKRFIDQEKKLLHENNAATRETQRIEETMTKEQEALQMQLNGAESEVEKLKQETEALKDTLFKEKVEELEAAKAEVKATLDVEIEGMKSELQTTKEALQSSELRAAEEQQSLIDEHQTKVEELKCQLETNVTLRKEINWLNEAVDNGAKLLQEQQEESQQAFTTEYIKAQEEIKTLEEKFSNSEEELTKCQYALSEKNVAFQEMEGCYKAAKTEQAAQVDQLNSVHLEMEALKTMKNCETEEIILVKEQIIEELKSNLHAQTEFKDSLKMNLDSLAEEYKNSKETLTLSMGEELAQMESQLMFAEEQVKFADNQTQEAKSELEEKFVNLKDFHNNQICQMERLIEVLQNENKDNKDSKKQLDQHKTTIQKLEHNCQKFEFTVEEYKVQGLLLQSKLSSHEMTFDELSESLNEQRGQTSDMNKTNANLKTELAQVNVQLNAIKSANCSAEEKMNAKHLELTKAEELIKAKEESIAKLDTDVSLLQEQKVDLKAKLESSQSKADELIALHETIEKLEHNCQKFEFTVEEYKVQVMLLQSKLSSHEMTYDELTESLNEQRSQTSDVSKTNANLKTELAQINAQLNAVKSASCSAEVKINDKHLELTKARELIKAKEESIAKLEADVSLLQEQKVDLKAKLESSQSKTDELLALNETKDGEIGQLLNNVNVLQEENALNSQFQTQIQGQLDYLTAEITQLRDEVVETKAINAEHSNDSNNLKEVISDLEHQCCDLKQNLMTTQTQLQESNAKCAELEEKLDRVCAEKIKFNEELTSSYDKFDSQKKNLEALKKEKDEMIIKLESLTITYESKIEELGRSLNANEEDIISKSTELMVMSVRYDEANEQVTAFFGCLAEKDLTIGEIEAKNKELSKQLNELDEKVSASNGHVEELEASIISTQAICDDATHQIAELSGDLEAAILAKMDAEETVETLKEEAMNIKDLEQQLSDKAQNEEVATAKCTDLENQASKLKKYLAAHVKTQDDLTEQLKHNQKLLTTSNLDLQEAKIESGQHFNEFEGIRCELVVSREERTRLGAQCDQLLADKERMASEISSLMERMNDAIKLGEDCSLDLQQCREALKTSNEEIVEFKQKIEAKEEMCDKFRSEVIQLKDKHHHLQGNVESLSLDKERMTRALEDESEKIDLINADNKSQVKFMEDKLAIMDKESKDLKQTIADLQEHLETKEGEFVQSLDELERDLAEKTKDCESTQVKIQNLTETCEKNTTELGNSQGKLDEAKKSNLVLEGQVEQLHTTVATLEKDVKTLKDDKNSKMSSIKLLLSNQRKLESQLKKTSNDHEDLAKEKEAMVQQVADRDALEVEVTKHHTRIAELEAEINVPIGQMSWEMDPELQDMTPMELRSILGKELTPHEKAKLNEMCVAELVKDMKVKTSNETSLIWEISTLKKELQKNKIKLNHLEDQRSVARALLDTDKVSTPPIESSTTTTTRKSKRRSVTMSKTQQEPNTSTRLSRSKMNVESESSSDVVVSATKKARKETSAVKVVEEKTRENPPSVVVGGRLKRGRSMMRLDNAMPDNPFTTKKSTASSLTTKRPLETITNKAANTATKDD